MTDYFTELKSKKWRIVLTLLVVASLSGLAIFWRLSKQPHYRKIESYEPHISPVNIIGEVVDVWCYASQTMGPGRGQSHLACAIACIGGGVTPGILEDNTKTLYIAAKYTGYKGCQELLLPLIGKKVHVTGWVGDLGGSKVLKITSVAPVEEKDTRPH